MRAHPAHDLLAAEVRGWYTRSTPEIGLSIRRERYGFLTSPESPVGRRLILGVDEPAEVAGALESAASFYGGDDFDLWVDDRQRAEHLAIALTAAGMEQIDDTVVLALAGPLRARPGPALAIDDVSDPDGLREWVTVKLQGFADSEERPITEQIDAEVAVRSAEWPVCRYQVARLAGEAVAILGHYTGQDQMVFLLATRLPLRHQGIAQSLLGQWCQRAATEGARSLLINCDNDGRPAALYRQMGFVDEVRWHRRYRRVSAHPPEG